MTERLRFSPAPTGMLHLGGARTALFNDLVARKADGVLVLRFEDTDADRADAAYESGLIDDLASLGVKWQEGPDIGGPCGPYRQSERTHLYTAALERLVAAGRVYRCFCAEEALNDARDEDAAEGRPPRYRGTCRSIPATEADSRALAGERFCWRFAVGPGAAVVIDDVVHGAVAFHTADIGDFLVARSDGTALYDLACAVDDAAMGITLVLRGDDHLANTPRQVLLLHALGAALPRYAHVPLVMGQDGRPLSKSRGAQPVASFRDAGYLPQAVVNHLALLGWSDPAGREVMSHDEIAAAFDLGRVSGSSPSHDPARLRWLNRRHAAAMPIEQRIELVARFVPVLPGVDALEAAALIADDVDVASDATRLLEGVSVPLPLDAEAMAALRTPTAHTALDGVRRVLSTDRDPQLIRKAMRDAGIPAGEAMPAVRAALTGRAHGLPVVTIVVLLGIDESCRRLAGALAG